MSESCDLPPPYKSAPHEPESNVSKHGDSDDIWKDALRKGNALLHAMTDLDAEAGKLYKGSHGSGQSPFRDIQHDLRKWGYTHNKVTPDLTTSDKSSQWKMKEVMAAHGLDHGGPVFSQNIWHQDPKKVDVNGIRILPKKQRYSVNGHTYRVTAAHNAITVDHKGGALYATSMQSPRDAAKGAWGLPVGEQPNPDELPRLRQFSDIMWGAWNLEVPDESLASIEYYFSINIQNYETEEVINHALESVDVFLEDYPGRSFGMDTDAGRALLGTPDGRVIGYLLSQHKAELGCKIVTKVDVFHNGKLETVLAFHIEDGAVTSYVDEGMKR